MFEDLNKRPSGYAGHHDEFKQLARGLADLMGAEVAKPPEVTDTGDDAIVSWCERELGVRLHAVPKVLGIFLKVIHAFRDRKRLRLAILGPRGGGKTKLTATMELVAYRFFGYDWQNVGGSLEQAQLCYSYIQDGCHGSQDLRAFTLHTQRNDTRSRKGDSISVSAASQTSVRGPHPRGSSGGGGLTLDEAAIIPDDICDAAKGQLTSADPSALIQLSTMGEKQVGRFWELLQDPKGLGYDLMSFDVFDVAKRCPFECATTCPNREHFAEDYYEGNGPTRQLKHAAYCGGKAHHVDGWIDVEEIAQHLRELGTGTFEREMMGKATAVIGHVYDPATIHAAVLPPKALSKDPEQHRDRFLKMDKGVSVDWGWAGQCALSYGLRLQDTILVYRWEMFSHERFQLIREHVMRACFEERIDTVLCDSANPSDNEELAEMCAKEADRRGDDWTPRVLPVVFSKYKDYGIGEVRRRLEQGLLKFATKFGDEVVTEHKRAMRYLLAYHTDDKGKPVKIDDHIPDALLMLCCWLSTSFRSANSFITSAAR